MLKNFLNYLFSSLISWHITLVSFFYMENASIKPTMGATDVTRAVKDEMELYSERINSDTNTQEEKSFHPKVGDY